MAAHSFATAFIDYSGTYIAVPGSEQCDFSIPKGALMLGRTETVAGYVVDLLCVRTWFQDDIWERGRMHTRECALRGCSIESGYALIQDDRSIAVLDPEATPLVVDAIMQSKSEIGIRLRVEREQDGDRARSVLVAEM